MNTPSSNLGLPEPNTYQLSEFEKWAANPERKNAIDIWREAFTQLRRLSDDVWNGLKFYLSINSILIGASAALIKLQGFGRYQAMIVFLLWVLGLAVTFMAWDVLTKQRDKYSEMLLKKALIEQEMGFYKMNISGLDISFPWGLTKDELDEAKSTLEKKNLLGLTGNLKSWVESRRAGEGSITRLHFWTYDLLMVIYSFGLVAAFFTSLGVLCFDR